MHWLMYATKLTQQYRIRDMVDTVPFQSMQLSSQMIFKALLGGINRRLDRQAPSMAPQSSSRPSSERRAHRSGR